MLRSIILFVALFGVSAVYGVHPVQLKLSQSYQERLHRFAVLEKCEKHDIATQSDFTSFISLPKTNDSRTFRFYSVAEKKIRFALTAVPEGVQDNFYAAEYFTFDITHNTTVVKNNTATQTLRTKPVFLENQPNEIALHLTGSIIYYFINGYKYGFKLGGDYKIKSFRYVSFAFSDYNFDSQDFFYDCAVHSPETNNMESWTDPEWVGTW